jgi:hypothetical protein
MDRLSRVLGSAVDDMEKTAEKARLLAKEEAAAKLDAEKRAHERDVSDYKLLQEFSQNAYAHNDDQMGGEAYNKAAPIGQRLGLPMTPMVGGQRQLSGTDLLNMDMTKPNLAGLNKDNQPIVQDFRNDQSRDRGQGWSSYVPKYEEVDPTKDRYLNGKLVSKGIPKPPSFVLGGNGGLVFNPQTGETRQTGYTPPMTPDQIADNQRQDASLAFRKQVQSEVAGLRAAAAKVRDDRGMAALKLRAKQWARKTATNELTGIVDPEQAALNEEQLMQELGLIAETAKQKRTVASPPVSANAEQASQKARTALTNVLGGGPGYLAFSQAYPEAHAAMLEFYRQRGMGNKSAVMPYTGEQIREMRETANGSNPPRPKQSATTAAAPGSRGVQAAEDVLNGMQF